MTTAKAKKILSFLQGSLNHELDGNAQEVWEHLLGQHSFRIVMSAAQDYVHSERAKFGFPKPYDILPDADDREAADTWVPKCPYCGAKFKPGEMFFRDPLGRKSNGYWSETDEYWVKPQYQTHVDNCPAAPSIRDWDDDKLDRVKKRLMTFKGLPDGVVSKMLECLSEEESRRFTEQDIGF